MNAALHAVEVGEVKVRGRIKQNIRWNVEANLAEVRVARWTAIPIFSHEEETVDFAVDWRRRVATVVLPVDRHDAIAIADDVVEVFHRLVAVEPVALGTARLTAVVDGSAMQSLQITRR